LRGASSAAERRAKWPQLRRLGCAAALICLASCSLVSIKSPERPLSTRDLNARILTREQYSQFVEAVAHCGRGIAAIEDDSTIVNNTLPPEPSSWRTESSVHRSSQNTGSSS